MEENKHFDDLDKELAEVNQHNQGVVDMDEPEEGSEGDSVGDSPKDNEKKEDEDKDKPDDKNDAEPSKQEGSGDEPPKEGGEEDKESDEEPEPEPSVERQKRPERYIPIPKYKEEKAEWQKSLAEKDKEIERLKSGGADVAGGTEAGSEAEEKEIRELADELGLEQTHVKKIVDISRKGMRKPEEDPRLQEALEQAERQKDEQYFNQEFSEFEKSIREQYPEATDEQIEELKTNMDKVAHTPGFNDKELDYVFYKNKSEFEEILKPEQPRPGPEKGRVGSGKPPKLSASDFKPDKNDHIDFSPLNKVSDKERSEIVSSLPPEVYDRYVNYIEGEEMAEGVEVNRGGRPIKLK